jgi:protein phosphatase
MKRIAKFFRRKRKTNGLERPTAAMPINPGQFSEAIGQNGDGHVNQLISGSAIDVGRRRENNEDAMLGFSGNLAQDGKNQVFGFFAVADGMGGHRNGELASEFALRAVGNHVMSELYNPLFGPNPKPPQNSLREILESGLLEAHRQVQRSAPGGGCTITTALIFGTQVVIGHLGDSRAYSVYKDGRIQALTQDHTLVNRLVDMGEITAEEAETHPQKSVLIRALGQGSDLEADIFTSIMPQQGYLLLCTDGLWGVVSDSEMQKIINSAPNANLAAELLVEAANKAGGPDNIAAILVQLVD